MLIALLLTVFSTLYAPGWLQMAVISHNPISYYEPLLRAVSKVESMDGLYVYNEKENAVGWLQIRQVRVDHYNRLTGKNYELNDFYDLDLSRQMFLFFAKGKSYEEAAKQWNGSGPMTETYWNKIQKNL
jgi:hypothetical protein